MPRRPWPRWSSCSEQLGQGREAQSSVLQAAKYLGEVPDSLFAQCGALGGRAIVQGQDAPGRRPSAHSAGSPCVEGKGAVARSLSPGNDLEPNGLCGAVDDRIPDSHRWPVVARRLRGDADDHLLAPLQIRAEPLGLEEITSRAVREAVVLQSVSGPVESGGEPPMSLDALSDAEERRPVAFLGENPAIRAVYSGWGLSSERAVRATAARSPGPRHRTGPNSIALGRRGLQSTPRSRMPSRPRMPAATAASGVMPQDRDRRATLQREAMEEAHGPARGGLEMPRREDEADQTRRR